MLQALESLGIDEAKANEFGLRVLKVASPWPLVPQTVHDFAQGLEKIIVVEEKRALIEVQLREYSLRTHWPAYHRQAR